MKNPLRLFTLTLLLAAVTPAQDYSEFVEKFAKAVEYTDQAGLDRAVRSHPNAAIRHFGAYQRQYAQRGDAETYEVLDTLKQSWRRVFDTGTLELYERYDARRDDRTRQAVAKAERTESPIYNLYHEGLNAGEREKMEAARESAMELARTYQSLGHALSAAKLWSLSAEISLKMPSATVDDRRVAVTCLGNFLSQREQWEWTEDALYQQNKVLLKAETNRLDGAEAEADRRREQGYSEDITGIDSVVMPNAEEQLVPLEFEVQKQAHTDLFFRGGPVPGFWLSCNVRGAGPTKIDWFVKRPLFLVRPAAAKFGVTIEELEQGEQPSSMDEVEPNLKLKPSVFSLSEDGEARYAMSFYTAGDQETLVGMNFNLAPRDDSAQVYYRSASSWVAELAGEEVTFYDDNSNGRLFEGDPWALGMRDYTRNPVDGVPVPSFDSMQVGKGDTHPLSDFVQVGEQWFALRGDETGQNVGIRPVNPEYFKTGSVVFRWKGARGIKPEVLVLSGQGVFANTHFNVASGKPVEVPVGKYQLSFGRIASGKGSRGIQAHVYHGNMEDVVVVEGETTEFTLGAPFTLDFARGGEGQDVEIDATSIAVYGAGGERYSRINGAAPAPEVLVARSDSGKGAKPVAKFVPMDSDYLNGILSKYPNLALEVGFFPKPEDDSGGTMKLRVKMPAADMFVGLQEKKNKLFGPLKPVWKQ